MVSLLLALEMGGRGMGVDVLVADRDEAMCAFFTDMLGDAGYQVARCVDPPRLLSALQGALPQMLILDSRFDRRGLHRLAPSLRQITSPLAILCVTFEPLSAVDRAYCAAAQIAVLMKPFVIDAFLDQVDALLAGRSLC
jgi:DNA-binding response OmpR family regulator